MARPLTSPLLVSLAIGLAIGALPYWWNSGSFLWPPPPFASYAQGITDVLTMPGVPVGALLGMRTQEVVTGFNVLFWTLVSFAFLGKTDVRW